nr:glutamic acid-rich protein-like [Tanacetum cinerariifolium]
MASFDYRLKPLYTIKECSSCRALYTTDYCCSNESLVDKIICDPNKAPDSLHLHTFSSNQRHCFQCKDVLRDGEFCQRCTCMRCGSGLSKGLCLICGNNQNSLNDSPSISDNSSQSPPHINHHRCYECGDPLDGIFCHQCNCESCRKGAHYGYNCPPKVPVISNPEPCNNQTIDELPHTLPSFDPTCYSGNKSPFTCDSTPNIVDYSPNVFNPPPQPPKYSYEFYGIDAYYGYDCPPQQKKEKKEKQIVEEKAAKAQYWKIPVCYDDDEDYTIAITPKEHDNSLSMGDDHLDTILATESDEFIKSTVENLVLNPNPHHFNAESDLIESLLNQNSLIISSSSKIDSLLDEFAGELTLLKSIPSRINETDCDPEEETCIIKRLLHDNSSPHPPKEFIFENSDAAIESFSPFPISVEDSDPFMEEIDLSFTPDDSMPTGIKEDNYDSERDILIPEELLSNNSVSLPKNERNLKLRDEDGIVSIPDTELFENLTLMGYNISQNQKLTFQKGQFSHQWKYLIHTMMQYLSPKSTGFNEFSSNIATALVCLATNRTYNFSKMIFDGMVKNVNNKVSKFLVYPRIVPLFDTMLVHHGEGSGTPTEPHHTPFPEVESSHPTTSSIPLPSIPTAPFPIVTQPDITPIIQYSRRARIAQSSALPTVADEHASPVRDDSQGEACPTDSGFIADQDRATIAKSSTLPYDSTPRVTSPAADEGKDREAVATKQSGKDSPIKKRSINEGEAAAERISNDSEEIARVLTSMDAATVLAGETDVPTGSGFIPTVGPPATVISTGSEVGPTASLIVLRRKGKEVMMESDTPKKKKLQEQIDAQVARELEEQQEREDIRMNEQIARDVKVARIHAEEEIRGMINSLDKSNETIAKYLQEYQEFALELPLEKKIKLISDLVKYQEHYTKVGGSKISKAKEEGSKPREGTNPEDQLWTLTRNYMHAPVEWNLYDHVTAKDKEIFMLVEKDYPLRRGLALVMISYRLQVENYSQMAEDLLRNIYNIANTPRKQSD